MYGVGQKVHLFFSVRWLQEHLVVFDFTPNSFVRLYCDSCHISMHFKKTSELVNFSAAILILKMEEDTEHFWLYYFKKGKNAAETQ